MSHHEEGAECNIKKASATLKSLNLPSISATARCKGEMAENQPMVGKIPAILAQRVMATLPTESVSFLPDVGYIYQ